MSAKKHRTDDSPQFFRELVENLHDGVYFVDPERRITYWNRGAERISGYPAQEVRGSRCSDEILMHVDDAGTRLCEHSCPISATLVDGATREAAVYLHHKEGHRVPVRVRVAPIRDSVGKISGAVEVFSENSAAVAALQRISELQAMAYVDQITDLANRVFTEITLRARLEETERYGWPFGVLFADVDDFKAVNDRYGHAIGDRLLAMVARNLAGNLRAFDLVGRWGGDEFLVLVVNVDEPKLHALAERFRTLVASSAVPSPAGEIGVTISVGGTLARSGDDAESLVARADALMYEGKRAGGNAVVFAPAPDDRSPT
jgi:diguanylate cyclase (GGDEF)-like protein/PAS domain S-box-containing protein